MTGPTPPGRRAVAHSEPRTRRRDAAEISILPMTEIAGKATMTTPDNERPAHVMRVTERVTIDTQTPDTICDQCMDPATHRVLLGNIPLYLVCVQHVSLVLGFIEAHLTGDCDAASPSGAESSGGQ